MHFHVYLHSARAPDSNGGLAAPGVNAPQARFLGSGGLAGCVPIPACAASGTYTMSGISARDLGGHSVTLIEMGGTYNQIESDGMPGGGPTMIPSVMH